MKVVDYDRNAVVKYAQRWAYGRNPNYYDFENIGGDCTNFASQCLYAGSGVMNYQPTFGWYYTNISNRSPSWTGVIYFHNFLVNNKGLGPFGKLDTLENLMLGDFIQLNRGGSFTHTLVVTSLANEVLVSTHTFDTFNRPLSTYWADEMRYIHIEGIRKN